MLFLPPDIAEHALLYLLVVTRLSGLMLTAPMLSGAGVPRRVKAMLLLTSAAAVHAGLGSVWGVTAPPAADLFTLAPLVVGELMVGASIGLIAGLPLVALEAAGHIMGHQMGLGIAQVYDPDSGVESDALARLLHMLALGAFLSMGGLETLFEIVSGTYETIPPGVFRAGMAPLDLVVTVFASGLEVALRAAAPALCVVTLILLLIGLLMKSAPQINVMTIGFAIKIAAGLAVTVVSLRTVEALAGEEIAAAFAVAREWVWG